MKEKLTECLELLLARYSNEQIATSPDLHRIYTNLEDLISSIKINEVKNSIKELV